MLACSGLRREREAITEPTQLLGAYSAPILAVSNSVTCTFDSLRVRGWLELAD